MRLIDADKFKGKVIASHCYSGVNKLINVDDVPTAYDVDEIVHRLDDESFLVPTSKEFWNNPQNGKYVENVVRLSDAIEIVKRGRKEQ